VKSTREVEIIERAKGYFSKREYDRALSLLAEFVEGGSHEKSLLIESFFTMANIFHMKGEIGKAIKAFNKVLSLDPAHTDAAISLSVLYNDIGHYEEAKRVFDTANERVKVRSSGDAIEDRHVNRKFASKHYEIAELYSTYGRHDEALFEYNKASSLDPDNLEIRVKVAKTYAKKNFSAKALDELKRLKNEHPNYLPGRVALGVLYYGCGKILEAQHEWENVLSKEPRNQEAGMYLNLSRTATETTL
jgi:tetratricopeptide (TPR) repeat protein